MSTKQQYKNFLHTMRVFDRRWKEQGIEDATTTPEWAEYEEFLYSAMAHFMPLTAGRKYGFYSPTLKQFIPGREV